MVGAVSAETGESESSTQVDIPDFLRPMLEQFTGGASSAFDNIQNMAGQNNTAGFSPDQVAAMNQARDVAGGAGGFIPQAQQQTQQTSAGRSAQDVLDPSAFSSLSGFAGGNNPLESFLPENAFNALNQTAGGEFLHGGAGFNAALEAAGRQSQKAAANAFGGSAGGVGSGLSRAAVGQGTADAFANQFAQERQNQLGAASSLGGFSDQERNRSLNASGILTNFSDSERNRQENATNALPGAGLLSANILQQIGGQQQQQDQRQIDRPQQDMMQLLQAALQGLPIEALLGQSSQGSFSQFGAKAGGPFSS
jgi:hypothetical protein